ncbi:MAG: putative DNA binding domain-containing protein [Acidobacteria bacterium]|nr:putative DNA binding domain-containing protein [Acidobacteriota bacterium]
MAKKWSDMVRRGEGVQVEFKRQCPKLKRLSRTLSAFSNSSGGTIFMGIDDEGEIVGLENAKGTLELVQQVSGFYCDPPVKIKADFWEPMKGVNVLVVQVPEAALKPVYAVDPNRSDDKWPYFRSDRENLPLDRKSLKNMSKVTSEPVEDHVGELDKTELRILDNLDTHPRQTLGQIAKSINVSTHRAKRILVGLEQRGWVHAFFNEKRREYSLAVVWKRR